MRVYVFALCLVFAQEVLSLPPKKTVEADCTVTDFKNVPFAVENCQEIVLDNLNVPAGESLRLPLKDESTVYFRGKTTFGYAVWDGPLVVINGTNVLIEGEDDAVLDGQGCLYWDGLGEWGTLKPKFFTMQLHRSVMRNIRVLNSPIHVVLLADSTDSELDNWVIDNSAGDAANVGSSKAGHNTDGFDIWNGTNVVVKNSIVYNQDDCVAIRCGANILIDNLICYGGHGLSISVGFSNNSIVENTLHNVTISNSILKNGNNGIHVKTHIDGGNGLIQNVTYKNIEMQGPANYGINIQENYRNQHTYALDPKNNIPIVDLKLQNVTGYVGSSGMPIYILCAYEGCFDWAFNNVSITGTKNNSCNYVPENFSC